MIINPFDNEQEFTSSDKLITHLTQLAVDKNNVFRGYGKQSELFPNIIREKDWREQEIRLLHEFERYGLQYFSANNPIDFMSYAQHYGLPTRLLDFTYNPFIALYFCIFIRQKISYKVASNFRANAIKCYFCFRTFSITIQSTSCSNFCAFSRNDKM